MGQPCGHSVRAGERDVTDRSSPDLTPGTRQKVNCYVLFPNPQIKRKRQLLQGDVPSPVNPPPGCTFHTRCPYAEARCQSEIPALREVSAGHQVACHLR
jgi:oligopeptide/dipeptide ABC transporter ATP-binding protein